jgi:hypothetical protein
MAGQGRDSTAMKKDVEGYIHGVSEIKTPASGNRYFDFKIQEREESVRVVCFSPEKRNEIKDNEITKSPVKLLNVSAKKRKYEPDSVEYTMNNRSKVIREKNMAFPWNTVNEKEQHTVEEIKESSINDLVSITAKVVWKGTTESVYSHIMRKTLLKCEAIIVDATGSIKATIWENMIPNITEGHSYLFQQFKVSFFNIKFVNGIRESVINEIEDIEIPEEIRAAAQQLKPKEKECSNLTGRVLGVDVSFTLVCVNCRSRITDSDDQFVNCGSCKTTFLKEFVKKTVSANVMVIDENNENKGRFYCSNSVLNSMFESIKATKNYNIEETDAAKLSRKMIVETLLLVKKVLFEVVSDEKLISSMQVAQ